MLALIANVSAQSKLTNIAPAYTPGSYTAPGNIVAKDSLPAKKWFISKYAALSSSFTFFNGGSANIISAPVGVQLNRRLSNNWYAFARVSVAPSWINFNNSAYNSNTAKAFQGNSIFNNSRFDILPRAEMGVMYINSQKTFSITGSISVQKSNYPWMYPAMGSGFQTMIFQ